VRPVLREMVALMSIPLIQGTLRYAYKIDKMSGADKEKGEGAIFAAAIVPRVHYCNPADGDTIMNNMKIGASSTSFTAVKAAFERNFACMNITCEEVGGIWSAADNNYYAEAGPCGAGATASWATIAGYAPGSKVTDHNALDLDQKAIELLFKESAINYGQVSDIYSQGGNSKAYARFTVNPLTASLSKGDRVIGGTSFVEGKVYADYSAGDTEIKVSYKVSDNQQSYVSCKVGALLTVPANDAPAAADKPYQYTKLVS